jgi:uncharacterized protein YoxC
MDLVIEISIAVMALTAVLSAIFLIRMLQSAGAVLKRLDQSISLLQRQVETAIEESVKLMQSANKLTADVSCKLKAADPLFASIRQAGESFREVSRSLRQVSAAVSQSVNGVQKAVHNHQNRLQEVVEWAASGLQLWQSRQACRQGKTGSKNESEQIRGDE